MERIELIFIPSPGLSHLVSTVEASKLLLDRDHHLSIAVLIMKLPTDQTVDKYAQNISSNSNTTSRLRFLTLPNPNEASSSSSPFPFDLIDGQATYIREIVSNLIKQPSEPNSQLAGLVLDVFCTKFVEIGDEFNLPSYVFFTSGACALDDDVKNWLDEQPERSVVFLCFGTMRSFEPAQVREIASALENSGKWFLWSLRKPGEKGMMRYPTEYEDIGEVLPEGFLERTKGIGKLVGWAAQVAVLSHPAVGGFVSHCGWNSILESVWFGVPMATFPLYAEQQVNAFLLVGELEMAEAITIDYVRDLKGDNPSEIVGSEEIEAAIRRLMAEEGGGGVREKVKEMQRSRMALMEGGSSYNAQSSFIEDVIRNNA